MVRSKVRSRYKLSLVFRLRPVCRKFKLQFSMAFNLLA